MSSQAFASLAQIQILLLPVGDIRSEIYEKWVSEIRTFDSIRLSDIPIDTRDGRGRFMPNPLSTGYLHLRFPTHPPPISHNSLSLFRPSHFPLGVLGIADCSRSENLSSLLDQFDTTLKETYCQVPGLPLARNCLAFEEYDDNLSSKVEQQQPGVVVIPSVMGNKKLYLGTLMAELCSVILAEFSILVKYLESPIGNELLNSSLFPILSDQKSFLTSLPAGEEKEISTFLSRHSESEINISETLKRGNGIHTYPKSNISSGSEVESSRVYINPNISLAIAPAKKRLSSVPSMTPHGRLYKLLADISLLAGRILDASIWYNEAAALFKSPQDAIWHASALEGLATLGVLDAWSSGNGLNASFSKTQEPWAEHSEKMTQAVSLYSKFFLMPTDEIYLPNLTYLYIDAVLRHSLLLFSIWSAKGWGPLAFMAMLHAGPRLFIPITLANNTANTSIHLERMTIITGISRSDISTILSQAHGPWLLHLSHHDRLEVLQVMARLYSFLGFSRKEAYIIRELVNCIMDYTDDEERHSSAKDLKVDGKDGDKGRSRVDNAVLLRLMKHVCRSHHINLDAVKFSLEEFYTQSVDDLNSEWSRSLQGWPELQVGISIESVTIAEALSAYDIVIVYGLSILKTLNPILDHESQNFLYKMSAKAFAEQQQDPKMQKIQYWSGNPVVSLELTALPIEKIPSERLITESSAASSRGIRNLKGLDPFYYNPRLSIGDKNQILVVQKDTIEFLITLNNPYSIPLDLQHLSLSTAGVYFESRPQSVVLKPNSQHQLVLSGQALCAGPLTIRGCTVRSSWSASCEYLFPLVKEKSQSSNFNHKNNFRTTSKFKGDFATIPDASLTEDDTSDDTTSLRFLTLSVIPEQPLLRVRRTSLSHGAIMLYNGERSVIDLTLENMSQLPVDYLEITFTDSLKDASEARLYEGDMSALEIYEMEYGIIEDPVFVWDSEKKFESIGPMKDTVISITCTGKVDCSNGSIRMLYSYTRKDQSGLSGPSRVFYTRQLLCPVTMSVYHMLECTMFDVDHLGSIISDDFFQRLQEFEQPIIIDDIEDWCLLTLEMRNTYGLSFSVTVYSENQDGSTESKTTRIVAPGSTQRFTLPLRRFSLPASTIISPIPSLTERQFVVNKSGLTFEQELLERELFWYRRQLLGIIKVQWQEVDGMRFGNLSLRHIQLTSSMLKAMKAERISVSMALHHHDISGADGEYSKIAIPLPNVFYCLRMTVANKTSSTIVARLVLDVQPADEVIFSGDISAIPLGWVGPSQPRHAQRTICFMTEGRFIITWGVKRLGSAGNSVIAEGQFEVIVQDSNIP